MKGKRGFFGRVRAGSFLLSRTAALSAKVRRSLGHGAAAKLFCGAERTDEALDGSVGSRLLRKLGYHETVSVPIKKAVAVGACESRLFAYLDKLRRAFLHTRARFFGIAGLVFSLYTVGLCLARQFMRFGMGVADPADLCTAAVTLLISLLLLPCGKPLGTFFRESRLFSHVLIGLLGVSPEAWRIDDGHVNEERVSARGGIAFVAGTAAGMLTLVCRPHLVLLWLLCGLFCLSVFAVPEMGLSAAVMLLPLVPLRVTAVLIACTAVGYAQKFFRLKRVFRFRVPELFLTLTLLLAGLSAASTGEWYVWKRLLLFACIWFLTVGLMTTERLFGKYLSALTCGGLLTLLWQAVIRLTETYLPQGSAFLQSIGLPLRLPGALPEDALCCYVLLFLPLALLHGKRRTGFALLLLIALNAYLLQSMWLFLGLLIVVLLYAALAHGAWAGASLTGALAIPTAVVLMGERLGSLTASLSHTAWRVAVKYLLCGVGSGNPALLEATLAGGWMPDGLRIDLYTRLTLEGGVWLTAAFLCTVGFSLQRLFTCMRDAEGDRRRVCGCLASSVLMFLLCAFAADMWSDLRVLGVFWCLCPAASLSGNLYGYEGQKEMDRQWI